MFVRCSSVENFSFCYIFYCTLHASVHPSTSALRDVDRIPLVHYLMLERREIQRELVSLIYRTYESAIEKATARRSRAATLSTLDSRHEAGIVR